MASTNPDANRPPARATANTRGAASRPDAMPGPATSKPATEKTSTRQTGAKKAAPKRTGTTKGSPKRAAGAKKTAAAKGTAAQTPAATRTTSTMEGPTTRATPPKGGAWTAPSSTTSRAGSAKRSTTRSPSTGSGRSSSAGSRRGDERSATGEGEQDRLGRYRAKRDFSITPEPSAAVAPEENGWRFVVQRHRARQRHYDLRLEMAGVLASWAVPKGPTLDPKARRLAVHVEDHPIDYFDFEGVIPKGEYGGGDVIVWDWGTWSLAKGDDPVAAVEAGDLHLTLDGEKLRGRFVLVRSKRQQGRSEEWLLLHKDDEFAVPGWDAEDHLRSVRSGRTNDEVAADPDARGHE